MPEHISLVEGDAVAGARDHLSGEASEVEDDDGDSEQDEEDEDNINGEHEEVEMHGEHADAEEDGALEERRHSGKVVTQLTEIATAFAVSH